MPRPATAVEVDIFGELVTGTVVAEPLYDPENAPHQGLTAVNPNNSLAAA